MPDYNARMKIAFALLATVFLLFCIWLLLLFIKQDGLILRPELAAMHHSGTRPPLAVPWNGAEGYRGLLIEPSGEAGGTVLIFHGNASLADGMGSLAEPFLRQGLRVVLQEYPGFGSRPGRATVDAALDSALQDFRATRSAWPGPIFVAGHSFGAGIAAQVAGMHPGEIAGVALFTPWNSLKLLVNDAFGGLPIGLLLRNRLDSGAALQRYSGPIVIVAGEYDTIVPARHAKALAQRLQNAHYMELAGADHISWLHTPMDAAYAQIFRLLGLGRAPLGQASMKRSGG